MPNRPLAYCSSPGCSARVVGGTCPTHSRQAEQYRGSAASRGYDRAWQRFRSRVLNQRLVCADCADADLVTLAVELHHLVKLAVAPHLRLVESNVRALCKPCHSRRTQAGQ